VRIVGHQVLGAKGRAALVDVATLGAHQKNLGSSIRITTRVYLENKSIYLVVDGMKDHAGSSTLQADLGPIRSVHESILPVQCNDSGDPQLVLHEDPVEDPSIGRHREEVYFAVGHVETPPNLPHALSMFAVDSFGHIKWFLAVLPQIVHSHIAVIQANHRQERISRMDITAHYPAVGLN